jgi:hypothetical protein
MLHIDIPTLPEFKALAATRSDACVSIYVSTSPLAENAQANRIAFEDPPKEAEACAVHGGTGARRATGRSARRRAADRNPSLSIRMRPRHPFG